MLDQRDVDGEIAVAADELLGAVERIDQEEAIGSGRHPAGRHALLGHHRHLRRKPFESGEQHDLGQSVGFGHRRRIGLEGNVDRPGVNVEDDPSGLDRSGDQAI